MELHPVCRQYDGFDDDAFDIGNGVPGERQTFWQGFGAVREREFDLEQEQRPCADLDRLVGADGPGFDRRTPTVIVSHTSPDDVPAGGVCTFVRSPREADEVAIRLAGPKDVDLFSASIGVSDQAMHRGA